MMEISVAAMEDMVAARHSAKYGSYTLMLLDSNTILDLQLIQAPLPPAPQPSVGPPGVISPSSTMAPPSFSSFSFMAVGPTWLLLLPPVFSLVPPSVSTALDSVCLPPPSGPSTS
ncbi:hypothetical protein cypCar_00035277 [Cyprinus carpio]|nr:hypothetical protein cypCar_00035277 [Cyprinus carpio]